MSYFQANSNSKISLRCKNAIAPAQLQDELRISVYAPDCVCTEREARHFFSTK